MWCHSNVALSCGREAPVRSNAVLGGCMDAPSSLTSRLRDVHRTPCLVQLAVVVPRAGCGFGFAGHAPYVLGRNPKGGVTVPRNTQRKMSEKSGKWPRSRSVVTFLPSAGRQRSYELRERCTATACAVKRRALAPPPLRDEEPQRSQAERAGGGCRSWRRVVPRAERSPGHLRSAAIKSALSASELAAECERELPLPSGKPESSRRGSGSLPLLVLLSLAFRNNKHRHADGDERPGGDDGHQQAGFLNVGADDQGASAVGHRNKV